MLRRIILPLLILIGAACALLAGSLLAAKVPLPPAKISVAFLGFREGSNAGPSAVICVTNLGGSEIEATAVVFEKQDPTNQGAVAADGAELSANTSLASIKPGEARIVMFAPAPRLPPPWRITVSAHTSAGLLRNIGYHAGDLFGPAGHSANLLYPAYTQANSPWINDLPPSSQPATNVIQPANGT